MPLIELSGIDKDYWPGPVRAVSEASLAIEPGEIMTLLGPSGCGKTTTLRLIAGFERPTAGTIQIAGRTVAGAGVWTPPERRGVGMVFQDYALFPHLTVAQNVIFGLNGTSGAERRRRGQEVLDLVGLAGMSGRYPHELSGGQQQRVALARAIAPEPVVVLLDEPFSNLDNHLHDSVRDEVLSIIRSAGITAVFVTHDQRDALAISDRITVMNKGRIEQIGTPREIYKDPVSIFVATFVGRSNLLQGRIRGKDGCVLTDFGSFCRVDRSGLPEGSEVLLAVRPDSFQPSIDGDLRGRVVRATYAGNTVETIVDMETLDGSCQRVVVHLNPGRHYRPDEAMTFHLLPEFVSVVRNACQIFQSETV
ncbi:MAG: ABC transporter ATP-binding protein [Thermaerobacterales bacterium]